ncbi:MAG TPA: thioredoxin family protein [Chloroflexota bacterium]|nr:thioredoxin family protein [Chloroflexota bacterium]
MEVKVLGKGCANCMKLEAMVHEVVKEKGLEVNLEHVRDEREIVTYGVMKTPGLVVDGKVVSYGRIPSKEEIASWLSA